VHRKHRTWSRIKKGRISRCEAKNEINISSMPKRYVETSRLFDTLRSENGARPGKPSARQQADEQIRLSDQSAHSPSDIGSVDDLNGGISKEEPTQKEACFGIFLKRAHRSVVKSREDEVIITQYAEEGS